MGPKQGGGRIKRAWPNPNNHQKNEKKEINVGYVTFHVEQISTGHFNLNTKRQKNKTINHILPPLRLQP